MSCNECNKKNVFQTATSIAKGIYNVTFENPEIEAIAKPRLEKCSACSFARILVRSRSKIVLQCTECLCLCDLKTRVVEEKCPQNKW